MNPTTRLPEAPTVDVLAEIARRVDEAPGHPALDDGTTTLSYADLWTRVEALAGRLVAAGVGPGAPVVVHGPRSLATAVGLLGTVRAGAVAVPVSTATPPARALAMVRETGATQAVLVGATPEWVAGLRATALAADGSAGDGPLGALPTALGPTAAIFFTSGTTGTPKGVEIGHGAVAGLASWYRSAFAVTGADRVSMVTNLGFVVTLRNLFAPLSAGATVCIAPDVLLPEDGLAWVDRTGISVLHTTPTTARSWLRAAPTGAPRPTLRWTLFGGEPLEDTVVGEWRAAIEGSRRIANVFGATELGASRAWFEVPADAHPGRQPIGNAIPGTQLLVVDAENRLCATGETGELLVRSTTLPFGYTNDADATARAFVRNPFSRDERDRVYRTGDLARMRDDGTVELVGRADDQCTIGGLRIELGEIATVLRGHEAVAHAEVLMVDGTDHPEIVAFVVATPKTGHPTRLRAALRRHCGAHLPVRAIPGRFVVLDRMPIGATGKLDRAALLALLDEPAARRDPRPDPTLALPDPPAGSLLEDIESHVVARPTQLALTDGTTSHTYAELWARADAIAGRLAGAGVTTGTPVLVAGPRSVAFATAVLAVLRAGGVVVPCASMLPDARCATMATELGATHAVVIGPTPTWAHDLITIDLDDAGAPRHDGPVATPAAPGEHAYVFFTSGTTGTPKAVLGRHASLAAYLRWWRDAFAVTAHDRVSMATSTAFDVTLRNLFGPLVAGATACVAPDGLLPEHGLQWLADTQVSVLHVTPSLAASWLDEAGPDAPRDDALRWTLFAGEMLTDTLVARWRATQPGAVGNMYGPTETTMSRCLYVVPDAPRPGPQPVGTPLPGSQMLVVDDDGRLCEVGVPGEVLVRTRAGTAGYANNAAEQALRFVPNPFTGDPDDIVYRTGDRGTYLPDGNLLLAGRVDDQVKIGGVRVEPAEVTAALLRHDDVRAAHVQAIAAPDHGPELVAFVVADVTVDARAACTTRLRRHCGGLLAPAAVPGRFVYVDRLPMTSNGKVDRAALLELVAAPAPVVAPAPEVEPAGPVLEPTTPALGLEELLGAWRTVLRRDDIEADTNFFDVGGSSVMAVRLGHRLRDLVDRAVTIHDLLDAQTPRELLALLTGASVDETEHAADPSLPVLHRQIARWATVAPDTRALDAADATCTYRELEIRVRAVAHHLRALGVGPGALVAVHATRTASLIPALLGIHRAGAGYVPIDPDLPSARVAFLIGDCSPAVAITDRPLPPTVGDVTTIRVDELERAMAGADDAITDVVVADDPERVAYVIYTSGSTGNPKGVLVPQRGLTAFVDAANERYDIRADDRLLQYHSLSFDTSVEEIFCALGAGATLVLPNGPLLGSAGWFVEQLEELRISVLDLPTSFWMGLVDDLDDADLTVPSCVRVVIVGGSAAKGDAVTRWCRRVGDRVTLCNAYGPTEVTIAATAAVLVGASYAPGELVTIGPALRGVQTLVLDHENRDVADGEPGELLLGGDQLALGYLNRPELTAEKFVVDPTGRTTDRYYRTGDRVRRTPDGAFVFEARVDDQVKIRGYRFELGEIEAAFGTHASVREAVALLEQTDQDAQIIVHVVLREGHDPSVDELRAHAAALLPSYAMPALIERRSSIPRTPGGKPDRRALRAGTRGPLGFAQEQQWFLHRLDPASAAYNITKAVRLRGPLDRAALDHALNALLERHESLRTRYLEHDDAPVQVVDEPTVVPVPTERIAPEGAETPLDAARRLLVELDAMPFDLERDLLFRPVVIELGGDDRIVALRSHHIAIDGWSTEVLLDELLEIYAARVAGRMPDLGAEVVQPRELAAAERAREADGSLATTIDRCVARLTPLPALLPLPLDRPRPSLRDPRGRTVEHRCGADTATALRRLARELRTTPFSVGLALFTEFLAGWCGTDDLVIGTPSADRDAPGSDRTVGMLVNTLPLRLRAHRSVSVRAAIDGTSCAVREAIADKGAPFDRVVRGVHPPRIAGVHPLLQVMFQTAVPPRPRPPIAGLEVEAFLPARDGAKFDFCAELVVGDDLTCRLVFATDLFDDTTMEECTSRFTAFVIEALRDTERDIDEVRAATGLAGLPEPVTIDATATSTYAPLTHAQERMWLQEQLDRTRQTYLELFGRRIVGPLDVARLRTAIEAAVARHEPLRTRLVNTADGPVQEIDPPGAIAWQDIDLPTAADARDAAIDAQFAELAAGRQDIERGPLFECRVVCFAADDHALFVRVHHAVFDGPSTDLLMQDVHAAYAALGTGADHGLVAPTIAYRTFAQRQRDAVASGALDADVDWWADQLAAPPAALALPYDHPAPAHRGSGVGRTIERTLPSELDPAIGALAKRLGTTRQRVGLALFDVFLHRLTGADDIVLGMAATERLGADLAPLVGLFVNTLPIRVRVTAGDTLGDLARQVHDVVERGLEHRTAPFDLVLARVRSRGERLADPFLPASFDYRPPMRSEATIVDDLRITRLRKPDSIALGVKFDLDVSIDRRADGPTLRFRYDSSRFEPHTAAAMVDLFLALAEAAVAEPDRPIGSFDIDTWPPALVQDAAPPVAVPDHALDHALELVLRAFDDLLGRPVAADDDFFASGGHSLLAVKLCSRIERESGVRLAVSSVFDLPTARALAALVAGVPVPATPIALAPTPAPAPPVLPAPTATVATVATVTADPRPTPPTRGRPTRLWLRRAPLSFAQRRLWTLEQLGEAGDAYILTSAYDLYGLLDLDALRRAMVATAGRHEILRTRYVAGLDDLPEQIVDDAVEPTIVLVDLREGDVDDATIDARIRAAAKAPFDLAHDHPWRAVVGLVADGHAVLALSVHHIATDGESQGIILRDLVAAYNDPYTDRPLPALQYADHAVWQHAGHAGRALEASVTHWVERLTPVPEPLRLPTATTRRAHPSGRGDAVVVRGGRERCAAVDAFARANRTTPFAVMLTAYEILLHRLTAREDIVVGIPVTERTMDDDTDTVGFYVNTLPIRVAVDPAAPAGGLVTATQRAITDALAHADAPLDVLIERLAIPRDHGVAPLVQTMFSMQEPGGRLPVFDGLLARRRRIGIGATAKFDLSLIANHGTDLELYFEYRDDVVDRMLVEQWAQQYLLVLDELLRDPARPLAALPVLDEVTERWLVEGCNLTRTDYPRDRTVHQLFRECAQEFAERVAIVDGARSVTYRELEDDARRVADQLRAAGVHAGDRVALELGRSLELVVAMIATLECEAAYVPVDPTYPENRRAMMHALARATAVVGRDEHGAITVRTVAERAAGDHGTTGTTDATSPAYVMFTSGSTGTPKGVVVPHRGIVRLVRDTDYVRYGDDLVVAHLSNTSFDAATFEIWGALLNGARLVVLDRDTIVSPAAFAEAIREHGITTMFVTTALFNVMAREAPGAFAPVRDLLFGGEAADPHAVRAVLADRPPERLCNVYGPTESTTFASWHRIERLAPGATSVPIGRPIANTTLHVVDASGRPVPPLVEGELLIGGDGLASGYLDDPALTAARFVPDTFSTDPDARLYRTGDIVRRRIDGSIEFVGRRDHQVKIRGFRIELGDIEASLRALDGVDAAHVITRRVDGRDALVHAYVVATRGHTIDGAVLREQLRSTQPDYLVPDAVLVLDALPINANGKIDRDALPVPEAASPTTDGRVSVAPTAPADALEATVLDIWQTVLGRDGFGIEENFFELGGNSIRAVQVFAAVERRTGVRLGLSALFAAPTVRTLAAALRTSPTLRLETPAATTPTTPAPAAQPDDEPLLITLRAGDPTRRTPLYCVHPAGGQVFAYAALLPALPADQTVIGIREHGWGDESRRLPNVEAYAARYVDEVVAHRPTGAFALAGYSLGGLLAYEMARLLTARGRDVDVVLLLDAAPVAAPGDPVVLTEASGSKLRRRMARDGIGGVMGAIGRIAHRRWNRWYADGAEARRDRRALRAARRAGVEPDPLLIGRMSERAGAGLRAVYLPERYDGRLVCFRATGVDPDFPIPDHSPRWHRVADDVTIVDVPGNHAREGSMLTPPHVDVLGARVAEVLDTIRRGNR